MPSICPRIFLPFRRAPVNLLGLLRLCLLLLLPCAAHGTSLSVHDGAGRYPLAGFVDVLEDPDGRLTLEDVRQPSAQFRPTRRGDDMSFGYRHSTYWLRLVLTLPPGGSREHWSLELAYPTLDSVNFYRMLPGGDYQMTETGDTLPFGSRRVDHRNYVFPVDLSGANAGSQVFYLRIRSAGSLTFPLTLWQDSAFAEASQRSYAALSLYFGAFAAMALYNLMLYFSLRDRVFLVYVTFVASMALGLASQYGLAFQFLWPDWPALANVAYPGGFALAGLFGVLFTRRFLDVPTHLPRFDKVLLVLALSFAINVALPWFEYQWSAIWISLTAVTFCPLALGAGVWFVRRAHHGARYYLAAWGLLLVFTAAIALRNMGWMPSNFITLNGMQIGSALEMMLLSFALAHRYNKLRLEKDLAQQEALQSKQRMVDTLKESEQLLEQRVMERTAELEAANAKLEEQQKLLREMAHHDPLTGLANRLLLDIRLEHAMQVAKRHNTTLALLLLDLDGFKPVNDTYGHGVGDELLMELAQRMQTIVRQTDTVARLGGDEFIILLESVASAEAVMLVAEKLIAALRVPMTVSSGVEVRVGASIGLTLMTPNDMDREAIIHRADAAMYDAKAAGGNQARFRAG
ncbi:MAG: diguanylate cyclase [Rhodocyclaceae bacterium]|nr:MAG: diguanylate cyclase [Rhodocyclaceae bacterium]